MRPLSESTARVASHNFSRKYIALGRLVNQWEEIMGKDFADKAVPVKLHYRKGAEKGKPTASLDIATSAANATILVYQKDLILERINHIFGESWIKDIKFVTSDIMRESPITKKKIKSPLTGSEKKYLSQVLDQIEDQDIKERLEQLGKAILTDLK